MNNADFRQILVDGSKDPKDGGSKQSKPGVSSSGLGSRFKPSSTSRTVKSTGSANLFKPSVVQRQAKKSRSAAAPKGTKLASGYTDRTAARHSDDGPQDDKEARIKALEEQMKLGQIDRETFERLRDDITGGDIGATHLVKGLDRRLLERVRRGEDVLSGSKKENSPEEQAQDADEELEQLEQQQVAPVQREEKIKKGERALTAGVKRSRNDILAELKASRKAAAEAQASGASGLGSKFRAFGASRADSRIEKDEYGREVLITVDENGRVKRKVRKIQEKPESVMPAPDKSVKPLGMEVPVQPLPAAPPKPEDDDIFEGVGTNYDPLGALADEDDEDSSSSSEEEQEAHKKEPASSLGEARPAEAAPQEVVKDGETAPKRKNNYFNDTDDHNSTEKTTQRKPFEDATVLAAIKRAAALAPDDGDERETSEHEGKKAGTNSAKSRLLAERDRDFDDMFYRSDEDEDDGKVKLSQWKGAGAADDSGDDRKERGAGKQRKRGKKKRVGDKNNANDVMKVLEGRRGG